MLKSLTDIIRNSKNKINHSLIGLTAATMLYSGTLALPNKINAENVNPVEFKKTLIASDFNGASSVTSADLDKDGDLDVIGTGYYANEVAYWENKNNAQSWVKHTISTEINYPICVSTADFDSDGDSDLVVAGDNPKSITWLENTNGNASSWSQHIVSKDFAGAISFDIRDMDKDGDLDIVSAASSSDRISWFENNDGKGSTWTEHVIGSGAGAFSTYAVDIDNDGDLDILGAAQRSSSIILWENTKGDSKSWLEHIIDNHLGYARCVYAADVDNDGIPEILGAGGGSNNIVWYKKTGENWIKNIVAENFVGANFVYPADLDRDGDIDIIGTANESSKISWFENILGGSKWIEHKLDENFSHAYSPYAADLDKDGDLDVLGAAHVGDQIAWWENQSLTPTPTPTPIPGPRAPIEIFSPKTGDIWEGDTLQPIHWRSETNYSGTAVRFELWGTNEWGNNERVGDLGYSWDPDGDATDYVLAPLTWPETNYNVRVYSLWDSSLSARSDNFTITGNAVKVVSPRGNEIWPIGSLQYIHWEANREIAGTGVRFELWGGKSPSGKPRKVSDLELLASDPANYLGIGWDLDGEDVNTFVVPQVAPGNYTIKAVSTWNKKYSGESGPIKIVK